MSQEIAKQNDKSFRVRPRVDVFENEAEYLVRADVPGASKEALEVGFHDGQLTLTAKRAAAATGTALAEELRHGDYERVFAMPDGIDADKIEAKLANGVLEIKLPKAAAKRPRKIEVRAS